MQLRFILPSIKDLKTGGNIFNQNLIASIRVAGHKAEELSPSNSEADILLVDSLEIDRFSKEKHRLSLNCLLLHYHRALDTSLQVSASEQRGFRQSLAEFDVILVTSLYMQGRLIDLGLKKEQIYVIKPGLDPSFTGPVKIKPASATLQFISIASLTPNKGYMQILKALETLSNFNFTWKIIGEETLEQSFANDFRKIVSGSKIQERVTFLGKQSSNKVIEFLDQSDIFLSGSVFESAGMAVLEAMARGLPVVAFAAGALINLLPQQQAAITVGDIQSYANAAKSLMQDKAQRQYLAKLNRQVALEFGSWQLQANQLLKYLSRNSLLV